MEALLILPLVVVVALCAWVIWRGLRKPKPPEPLPDDSTGDKPKLSPGGGGTPR